jgi:hypothetical protein
MATKRPIIVSIDNPRENRGRCTFFGSDVAGCPPPAAFPAAAPTPGFELS